MNFDQLKRYIADSGIVLTLTDDRISIKADDRYLTPEFKKSVAKFKPQLIERLKAIPVPADPSEKPFPHDRYYWRDTVAIWPIGLRQQWSDIAEYWMKEKGDSNLWAEYKAFVHMNRLIKQKREQDPNFGIGWKEMKSSDPDLSSFLEPFSPDLYYDINQVLKEGNDHNDSLPALKIPEGQSKSHKWMKQSSIRIRKPKKPSTSKKKPVPGSPTFIKQGENAYDRS